MDRMRFIPGQEAKEQILDANGHISFGKEKAITFADHFLLKSAPLGFHAKLNTTLQIMYACMSDGDRVDIYFGLRHVNPEQGEEDDPSGELVGHTWATLTEPHPDRPDETKTRVLWEVGRATPPLQDAHAVRAFNAYRYTLGAKEDMEIPRDLEVKRAVGANGEPVQDQKEFRGKPVVSRALSPSNLYYCSSAMWYFVDLSSPGDLELPMHGFMSRPMRSYDALILASLMTLVNGSPPVVLGIVQSVPGLGKMPTGFKRVHYGDDQRETIEDVRPLLVM